MTFGGEKATSKAPACFSDHGVPVHPSHPVPESNRGRSVPKANDSFVPQPQNLNCIPIFAEVPQEREERMTDNLGVVM